MPRRSYTVRTRCAEPGCPETGFWEADTRAEEQTLRKRAKDWRCVRHSQPGVVLSADETVKFHTLVSYETTYGRFWRPEGTERSGSSFTHGPGFKAFAGDFPPGTRLMVTAEVELPSDGSERGS